MEDRTHTTTVPNSRTRTAHVPRQTALALAAALALLPALLLGSCEKVPEPYKDKIYDTRKVLLLYCAGYSNLSSAITGNVRDIINGTDFHSDDKNADAVLIFSRTYDHDGQPYVIYPHTDSLGNFLVDTLITFSANTLAASAKTLNYVLDFVRKNFPADEYGLVFSSHGTGYLPAGYYDSSSEYENSYTVSTSTSKTRRKKGAISDPDPVHGVNDPNPLTRSIGRDVYSDDEQYEINLEDFVEAIPMHLKYIVFDACLLGGVEVAYQLREKTDWLIASPTEILSMGMNYSTMVSYLMAHPEGDFSGFCESYYDMYNAMSGSWRSATVSLTDCTELEPLADLCSELFSKYREALDNIDHNDIQGYYTSSYHWFFDLGDIVEHLGCDDEELSKFNTLMDNCVVYKAATPSFLDSFDITHFSGLSMMLPNYAGDYLKNYYKTCLEWNNATSLVE